MNTLFRCKILRCTKASAPSITAYHLALALGKHAMRSSQKLPECGRIYPGLRERNLKLTRSNIAQVWKAGFVNNDRREGEGAPLPLPCKACSNIEPGVFRLRRLGCQVGMQLLKSLPDFVSLRGLKRSNRVIKSLICFLQRREENRRTCLEWSYWYLLDFDGVLPLRG